MNLKPIYIDNFVDGILKTEEYFEKLKNLNWLTETKNRREYFMSLIPVTYVYSNRGYESEPFDMATRSLMEYINIQFKTDYNVCFFNRYDGYKDNLGWHKDDSPEMDTNHPIAVISLGQERDIYWKRKDDFNINIVNLKSGSIFIMPAHFQENHYHKIPKHHSQNCGTRISLTFRRYI